MVLLFWLVNRDYLLHIAVESCMWVQKKLPNFEVTPQPATQPTAEIRTALQISHRKGISGKVRNHLLIAKPREVRFMEDGRPRGLKAWWGAIFFGLQCIFNVLWSSHGLMAWEVAVQVRGRETLCPSSAKSLPS